MERKILVVEDSPTQAEHVRLLLEAEGYLVDLAANGLEGLERIRSAPPDLVISDIIMPEMDGYALCQAVKSSEASRRIPFVLLTERKTPLDILKGLERGADNFITKPFQDDYLLERVRRIFEHLEFRKKGQLDVEVAIRASGREILISPDKQQIIELLFASFEEICALNAQLAESKQRAEEASRHKSDFLAHVSHELRTPLNSILGFAELLQDPQFGTVRAKRDRYLDHIHQSGEHLLSLINDLLDLSKVEAGKLELRVETFPLGEAMTAAIEQFRAQVDAKGVALTLQVDQDSERLTADPLRFKQILYNLLGNAVKFTPTGGTITVTAKMVSRSESRVSSSQHKTLGPKPHTLDRGDFVEIAVQDTGIGIKTEDLSRLFQEFTQLDNPLAKSHQGTGLGLAMTKRLVGLHGGAVTVTSPGEGQGSTFTVTLPLQPPM